MFNNIGFENICEQPWLNSFVLVCSQDRLRNPLLLWCLWAPAERRSGELFSVVQELEGTFEITDKHLPSALPKQTKTAMWGTAIMTTWWKRIQITWKRKHFFILCFIYVPEQRVPAGAHGWTFSACWGAPAHCLQGLPAQPESCRPGWDRFRDRRKTKWNYGQLWVTRLKANLFIHKLFASCQRWEASKYLFFSL